MKGSLVVAVVWSLHLLSLAWVTSSQAVWEGDVQPSRSRYNPVRSGPSNRGGSFNGGINGGFNGGLNGVTLIPNRRNRTHLISDTIKAGAAVSNNFPNLTPPEALSVGKEALIGSPEKITVNRYSDICERNIKNKTIKDGVKFEGLGYALLTEPQSVANLITYPEILYDDNPYNPNRSVVVFIDGYKSNINKTSDARDALLAAYKARGDVDFIVVDTSTFFDEPYPQAAINTERVGYYVGLGLENMVSFVPLENIHLIGYGLGAQAVYRASRAFTLATALVLNRTTGLDPANPCFGEGEQLEGLQRGYARFVDIIHTNSGVLGKGAATGDADYYPNGEVAIQPGCFTSSCSHHRAWELYAESVYPGQERNFLATKCDSLRSLNEGLCTKYPPIPMGFAAKKGAVGKYFLNTRGRAPYGKNQS